MSAATTPTPGYLSSRSYSTDAGPFSHAGGGSALTQGKMQWIKVDVGHLPDNVAAYLVAQSSFTAVENWITTSYAGQWYALYMTSSGPIYLTYALGDGSGGGAAAGTLGLSRGPIVVQNPAQAVANFGTSLAQYIAAHGCDGSAAMITLVKGYQGALNAFFAAAAHLGKTFVPFVVDGIYSSDLQAFLVQFAKGRGITFTPCAGLPHGNFQGQAQGAQGNNQGQQGSGGGQPTPPPQTGGGQTQTTAPTTGLSTNQKIGLGVGLLGLAAVGLWAYSQSSKKSSSRKEKR